LSAARSHGEANRTCGFRTRAILSGANAISVVVIDEQTQYDRPVAGSTTQSQSVGPRPLARAPVGAYAHIPFDRAIKWRIFDESLSSLTIRWLISRAILAARKK